ncbi:hypothetical protein CJF39_02105 [Pseudomonas lundensis]|uniref:Uncharacterized protein n=1 Tax=Pseudomonas lundensis TaxID=86185 RepID=A0A266NEZ4_9PSED|nr:hypothetical protein CJF39_02105 [Pseudomonas lundensis]
MAAFLAIRRAVYSVGAGTKRGQRGQYFCKRCRQAANPFANGLRRSIWQPMAAARDTIFRT